MRVIRNGWLIPVFALGGLVLLAAPGTNSEECQHDRHRNIELRADPEIDITVRITARGTTHTIAPLGSATDPIANLGALCIGDEIGFSVKAKDVDSHVCEPYEAVNYLKDTELSVKVFTGDTESAQNTFVEKIELTKGGDRSERTWSKTVKLSEKDWGESLKGKWVRFEIEGTVEDEKCPNPKHSETHDGPTNMKAYQARVFFSDFKKIVATQGEFVRADSVNNRIPQQTGYACVGDVTLNAYSNEAGTEQHFPDGQPVWTAQKMPAAVYDGGVGPPGPPMNIGNGSSVEYNFAEPGLYRIHAQACDSGKMMFLTVVNIALEIVSVEAIDEKGTLKVNGKATPTTQFTAYKYEVNGVITGQGTGNFNVGELTFSTDQNLFSEANNTFILKMKTEFGLWCVASFNAKKQPHANGSGIKTVSAYFIAGGIGLRIFHHQVIAEGWDTLHYSVPQSGRTLHVGRSNVSMFFGNEFGNVVWEEEHKYVNTEGTMGLQIMSPPSGTGIGPPNTLYRRSSNTLWPEKNGLKGISTVKALVYKVPGSLIPATPILNPSIEVSIE